MTLIEIKRIEIKTLLNYHIEIYHILKTIIIMIVIIINLKTENSCLTLNRECPIFQFDSVHIFIEFVTEKALLKGKFGIVPHTITVCKTDDKSI